MREEEVDSLAEAYREENERYEADNLAQVAKRLTKVLEKVFDDFQESIDLAARSCHNSDATTALYNVSSALDMMDIPFTIRKALGVPHPGS